MSNSSNLFTFILIGSSLSLIPSVMAIMCWDCSSHINPGCGDPFYNHSFAMVDCDQKFMDHLGANRKATLCRKITQKVENDATPRVVRSCGWIEDDNPTPSGCITRSGTFSVLVEYCSCKTDGCNHGSNLHGSNSIILLITSFLVASFVLSSSTNLIKIQ